MHLVINYGNEVLPADGLIIRDNWSEGGSECSSRRKEMWVWEGWSEGWSEGGGDSML